MLLVLTLHMAMFVSCQCNFLLSERLFHTDRFFPSGCRLHPLNFMLWVWVWVWVCVCVRARCAWCAHKNVCALGNLATKNLCAVCVRCVSIYVRAYMYEYICVRIYMRCVYKRIALLFHYVWQKSVHWDHLPLRWPEIFYTWTQQLAIWTWCQYIACRIYWAFHAERNLKSVGSYYFLPCLGLLLLALMHHHLRIYYHHCCYTTVHFRCR